MREPLTKLVCTLGPATIGRERELVEAGMDVARINFSHGTDERRANAVAAVRAAAEETGRLVSILADLPGPKIRLGPVVPEAVTLVAGDTFVLRPDGSMGDAHGAGVTYPGLGKDVLVGDRILLADGAAELRVLEVGDEVLTGVVRGGTIRSRAGVNVPSERLSLPAVTDADRVALQKALELGVDWVAQSFVRRAGDLRELRAAAGRPVRLVAKLETGAAIDDLDAILGEADGVMLARGDLGVEIPYEEVPVVQKLVLARALHAGVPTIVATQMLESMTAAPRPTRAEATDVANAVLDGAEAVMLSAETAVGLYPIEAARAASRIATAAERLEHEDGWGHRIAPGDLRAASSGEEAVARAAVRLAVEVGAGLIACFTRTGRTAELIAGARPPVPVRAYTPDERLATGLALRRALTPSTCDMPHDTDELVAALDRDLRASGVPSGTVVVLVASSPGGRAHTNLLERHVVGG